VKPETREKILELLPLYPKARGALLPALYLVQEEQGYVGPDAAREVAELFELRPIDVWEVLSFYNMFYTEPQGRHHVYVCTNLSCALRGSRTLLRKIEAHLGVHAGETTPDGRITLGHEECLGSCGTAPMMRVDGEYHEQLDEARALAIVDALE
jgi:NADH-quinone oxidoreductase E subunit